SGLVLAAAEFHEIAAGRLHLHHVEPATDQCSAQAGIVLREFHAYNALAHPRENVDLLDWEVQHMAVGRGEEDALFILGHNGQYGPVPLVEPNIAPADLRGCRAEWGQRRSQ